MATATAAQAPGVPAPASAGPAADRPAPDRRCVGLRRVGADEVEARAALRRFASGVAVLTAGAGSRRHGTTVSALVAVSRDPLILAACLRSSSMLTATIQETGLFSVSVLDASQAAVAVRFADPLRRPGAAQFAGLWWRSDPFTGAPLLEGSVAHLSCWMTGCTPVGDHDVILAEVLAGSAGTGSPLLTFAGRLQSGPAPTPQE